MNGVNSIAEMQRCLQYFVKKELFAGETPPVSTNRRFFPTNVDVRNYMYSASVKNKKSAIDQENLEVKIEEWKKENPSDNFFFRPYVLSSSDVTETGSTGEEESDIVTLREQEFSKSLILVHQTQWQRELLQKYGGDICLLDATYKTTRYALPLFFLCVKTNVDYCVVGSFVVQHENADCICEALRILRGWNPKWKAKYFMVDFCEAEINAIEIVFPGKEIRLGE